MSNKKEVFNELEQLVKGGKLIIDNKSLKMESVLCNLMPNPLTVGHCQVIECVHNGDKDVHVNNHAHLASRQIIYVLEGTIELSDGNCLTKGEVKIYEPNIEHSFKVKPKTCCIIIYHPPETLFKKG